MSKKENSKPLDTGWVIEGLVYFVIAVFCFGGFMGYMAAPFLSVKLGRKKTLLVGHVGLIFGAVIGLMIRLKIELVAKNHWMAVVLSVWFLSFAVCLYIRLLLTEIGPSSKIISLNTVNEHRNNKIEESEFEVLINLFKDPNRIPIGLSYPEKEPIFLDSNLLLEHLTMTGATGQGKTTLLLVQLMHSLFHGKPAIVIDPKGDLADINVLMEVAELLGCADKIQVFSLANPETSASYNPCEVGTPAQIITKILTALDLDKAENPYYPNVAMVCLKAVIEAFDCAKMTFSIHDIATILSLSTDYQSLLEHLHSMPKSDLLKEKIIALQGLDQYGEKDLLGLRGALISLSLGEFLPIFGHPVADDKHRRINLEETMQSGKIAYFQLNINGYESVARRIGKIVLQDLKLVSSRFQAGQALRNFESAAVFVDEFGSFATQDFMNFLKMSRSAAISIRQFFQGLADLNAVSKSFEGQTIGNSVYKIFLRAPNQEDAESSSKMLGTTTVIEKSYQTKRGVLGTFRTGMGNQKESLAFNVHPDVFKNLDRGQGIFANKATGEVKLFQLWNAKSEAFSKQFSQIVVHQKIDIIPIEINETQVSEKNRYSFHPKIHFLDIGKTHLAIQKK